jgi:hypothetical protein
MSFRRSRSFQELTRPMWQINTRFTMVGGDGGGGEAAEIHFPWLWNLDIIARGRQGIMSAVRQGAVADLGIEYRTNTSVAAHKIAKNNEDDGKVRLTVPNAARAGLGEVELGD